MTLGGRLFRMRNIVDPLQYQRENSISIHVPYILETALFQIVQIGFCLSMELGIMTLSVHTPVLWARYGGDT